MSSTRSDASSPTAIVRLIGLNAFARAGKDALADILAKEGYERAAFADAIYDAILEMNPIVKVQRSGGLRYALRPHRRLGELVAEHGWHWIKEHCPEGRRLLNTLGAAIRKHDPEFWVKATMNSLNPDTKYVLTDCRFPLEVTALRDGGGAFVRITRPGTSAARDPLTGKPYYSEVAVADVEADYTLHNDGPTLGHFEADAIRLLRQMETDRSASSAF